MCGKMKRVRTGIKELYQQVGEEEYNRINPYAEMVNSIKVQYPTAKITGCKTFIDVYGSLQVPFLTMSYEVAD